MLKQHSTPERLGFGERMRGGGDNGFACGSFCTTTETTPQVSGGTNADSPTTTTTTRTSNDSTHVKLEVAAGRAQASAFVLVLLSGVGVYVLVWCCRHGWRAARAFPKQV